MTLVSPTTSEDDFEAAGILSQQPNSDLLTAEENNWDLVIAPRGSFFHLPFNEVWQNRDLLYLLTRRDIVSFYKQTILGPLWFFVQPIFTTLMFLLVFGQIAGLSTDGLPRIPFYLCGVTLWTYFAECFNKTSTVFKDNSHLFGKVYFPRIISPLSIVISNLVRFFIQLTLFSLVWCYYYFWKGEISPNWVICVLPVTILVMAMISLALGMIFTSLTTKYRDLVFLLHFGVQLLMYATPVIYPASKMPASVAAILSWNPLVPLFEATRLGFLGAGTVTPLQYGYSCVFAVVALIISMLVFNRVERTFMDTV